MYRAIQFGGQALCTRPVLHLIIMRFGLPVVFVGSGVEGEPFALAGGVLAQQANVPLWAAMAAAILGAWTIDVLWFTLGRRFRPHPRVRSISRRPAFARSMAMIERHPVLAVFLFRFAYGLRAVAPVAVGASAIPARLFLMLSFAAAVLWGSAFTMIGYWFGAAVGPWAADFAIAGALIGAGLLVAGAVSAGRSSA